MIIFASEALSLIGVSSSQGDQLEAMPALTIHSKSGRSSMMSNNSSSTTTMMSAAAEPFVVRLGVGPRWWS